MHVSARRASRRQATRIGRSGQAGNALLFALLGLVIAGGIATAQMEPTRIAAAAKAGQGEATVLETMRRGVNNAVFEQLVGLQNGQPLAGNGVSVAGADVGGVLTWRPTIAQLTQMGYLPQGWSTTRSTINDGAYQVTLQRLPAGCSPANCSIDGFLVVMAPMAADGAPGTTNGPVVGPILTSLGVDAGISLPTSPGSITGYGNSWSTPNPVSGSPQGVVGVRVGTTASGYASFVRINDTRDPALAGNLSAAGNLSIGGTASVAGNTTLGGNLAVTGPASQTNLAGSLTVGGPSNFNSSVTVNGAGNTPCIQLLTNGEVRVLCDGKLSAKDTRTDDLTVTNAARLQNGFITGANSVFTDALHREIRVGDDLYVRAGAGAPASMVLNSNGLSVTGRVEGRETLTDALYMHQVYAPGSACTPPASGADGAGGSRPGYTRGYAAGPDGSMMTCDPASGRWRVISQMGEANQACAPNGAIGIDASGGGLVCKRGAWLAADAAFSSMVMGTPFVVTADQETVNKTDKIVCAQHGGRTGAPLVYLLPQSEASINSAFTRYVVDSNPGQNGGSWTFVLQDGLDANGGRRALGSVNAIAMPYCYY